MTQIFIRKIKEFGPLFWMTVLLPTLISILYFSFFASDVYVSESRFVVRSPDKPSTSGLGLLLKGSGFSAGGDEVYAATDFILSRDALKSLNKGGQFEEAYSNREISTFDRFGGIGGLGLEETFEDLYEYYLSKIAIESDTGSSVTTLTVNAYSAADARMFNEKLLDMAEATINRLNQRGRQDLVRYAEAEVVEAQERAQKSALALSAYRNEMGVIDPEKQAAVQLQMISKLQDELIVTRAQLRQLKSFTPDNPQIPILTERAAGIGNEIETELSKVAGGQRSLSTTATEYQRLILDSKFHETQLASSMASLEDARNEARRKQSYVERLVQPNLPDDPLMPRRFLGVFTTFILGLVAWGIMSMLIAGMKEHQD